MSLIGSPHPLTFPCLLCDVVFGIGIILGLMRERYGVLSSIVVDTERNSGVVGEVYLSISNNGSAKEK